MANNLECYGLDFIAEDDDTLSGFVGYTVSNGKATVGYHSTPYLYMPMGDTEFWASTAKKPDGNLYVDRFHTHCRGNFVWDMVCSDIDISPKDWLTTDRLLMLNRAVDNGGLLPVDIINADILPSFLKGDRIKIQVVAQCLDINYYASQEEYDESMHADENGKKWGIANGTLAPISFMVNHTPDNYIEGKEYEDDSFVHFTATVKALFHGTFEFGENKDNTFIRCVADTQFGELEFHHSIDQVPNDMRKNIRIGSIISGVCMISGDAAIYDYENGIVKDFDHNLRLLRYTLEKGQSERLRSVLAESCAYETDNCDRSYLGADDIIARLQYVADNHEGKYIAHLAEISSIDTENMEYPIGTKCIVLADNEEDNYESIVFLTMDSDANITKIKVSTDGRYHFHIQNP